MPFPIGTVPGAPFGFKGQNFITAHAGGGQANATPLGGYINHVAIVATVADSVVLPTAYEALPIVVFNAGANALAVFPAVGDAIVPLTAVIPQTVNIPITLASGAATILMCYASQTKTGNFVGAGLWKQIV